MSRHTEPASTITEEGFFRHNNRVRVYLAAGLNFASLQEEEHITFVGLVCHSGSWGLVLEVDERPMFCPWASIAWVDLIES